MNRILGLAVMLIPSMAVAQVHGPLSQQKICDDAARFSFNDTATPERDGISYEYTSHYDTESRVCYVLVHGDGVSKTSGFPTVSYALFDAIEGRQYGNYMW